MFLWTDCRLLLTFLLAGLSFVLPTGLGQSRAFGNSDRPVASLRKLVKLSGSYTRLKRRSDENQSAILEISQISRVSLKFHLTALWWPVGHGGSPHNGEIEAIIPVHHHAAVYQSGHYRLTFRIQKDTILLTERGSNPDFGANVSAAGKYRRTRPTLRQPKVH